MKIEINNQELELKRTLRTEMVYEDLFHSSLDPNNVTTTMLVNLFIASVIAAQIRQNVHVMTKEEVMAWLEDDPIREMYVSKYSYEWIEEYTNYMKTVQAYYDEEQKQNKKKDKKSVTIETVDDVKKS